MITLRSSAIAYAAAALICSGKAFVLPPHRPETTTHHHHHDSVLHASRDDGDRCPKKINMKTHLQHAISTMVTAAVLFTTALTSPFNIHVNTNNPMTITMEKLHAYALNENQLFISDVWFKVTTQYFDQSFNGLGESGWRAKEEEALKAVEDTGPDDDELVADAIKNMLSALGDPYTRFLPKEKYEVMTAYATGGSGKAGIGVQLLEDPRTNKVVIMATTPGGPAALAGVQVGDIILKIDGKSMDGATAEVVAANCKGEQGQKVDVVLLRQGENANAGKEYLKTLTRDKVKLNPIQSSIFTSSAGKRVGLLTIPSFSTETVKEMVDRMNSLSDVGKLDAIAIDIRGNVGGFMKAGIDAANLFLPARARIIAEVDRSGAIKGYDSDGIGAETSLPLYLLVDGRTASAAEIFAAALQDNQRGIVVGSKTFGKGRIQNLQALENGGGVAITRARYITPKGRDLHGVGIIPNKESSQCTSADSAQTCLTDIL